MQTRDGFLRRAKLCTILSNVFPINSSIDRSSTSKSTLFPSKFIVAVQVPDNALRRSTCKVISCEWTECYYASILHASCADKNLWHKIARVPRELPVARIIDQIPIDGRTTLSDRNRISLRLLSASNIVIECSRDLVLSIHYCEWNY